MVANGQVVHQFMLLLKLLLHEFKIAKELAVDARGTSGLLYGFEGGPIQLIYKRPTSGDGEVDALIDCYVVESLDHAPDIASMSDNKEFLPSLQFGDDPLVPVLVGPSEHISERLGIRYVLLGETHHLVANIFSCYI